ncbi:hypothetical protein BZA05DRAFT_406148 [Tricharina praecox]|uniref:uncharacterized protein n=1 Tax=Tricharina praecox TaxID=43433 RepID=UPI002220FCE1|nr:uncharacterized protein BZA05DRAFT_413990 [Tricharina praecox]XP_051337222.1 uncharacterized protein BZA05DRAFT_406148 [Tricharina praecox]KAI5840605.1 hypothetical protein BZA05DRAFT_413990 [Tricharina praecox]KAI5847016.1 hypothetical protein BZA05DRAFT_406148 [Tricharina praecox]
MKPSILFTLLSLLLFATVFAQEGRCGPGRPRYRTFRLRADTRAPAPINTWGYLDWRLGWFATPGRNYRGYIEPYGNRTDPSQAGWGKLHDASAPENILWFRPTHGSPMYYVFSSDPQTDTIPALTLWDSFAVIRGADGRNWLGYGQSTGSWMGCRSGDNWSLYWGPQVGPPQCSIIFGLEVIYDRRTVCG